MGSLSTESFDEFLDSLKKAGVAISNELELRERLADVLPVDRRIRARRTVPVFPSTGRARTGSFPP